MRVSVKFYEQFNLLNQFRTLPLAICIILALSSTGPAHAEEIGIAFIDDGVEASTPGLSKLIVQELQPLLGSGDSVVQVIPQVDGSIQSVTGSFEQALSHPDVDYIVATGFIGSQEIYQSSSFKKPTYLLKVLDPDLTDVAPRDRVLNLRSYSTNNEITAVFQRISELFNATRVGIILPAAVLAKTGGINDAVKTAAIRSGIDVQFLALDFDADVKSQLVNFDAAILPFVIKPERQRNTLLESLRRAKIPSFAVGGDSMVLGGALISDTLDEDERVLARRVALDLQLAIAGESRTQGMRILEPKKRTTINIDTARELGIDFTLDELMTARVVQGNSSILALGFLSSLEIATDRNLDLKGQLQQLIIDTETLEQAMASKRPQLSAQLEHTRRGKQLPERDTLVALGASLTLYSPSANAKVNVAELGLDASKKTLQQKQIDTIQQTSSAYFHALQTQAQFESSLRNLALNRENLILAQQRKKNGSGTGAEIYRWQAIIAASENALLRAYTANTSAQGQLAQLLNTRLQIPTQLADVDLDQPPFDLLHESIQPHLTRIGSVELLRKASAKRALARSPRLVGAAANVAINNVLENTTRRSFYTPELSLSAQYGHYLDSSQNTAGIELDNEYDWSLSLSAKLPLWDGGTRKSLIRQYTAQGALADAQLQSATMAIWANSGNAVNNLVAYYRSIALSDQAEKAALKSQQITQQAYKLGAASVIELLDTQNEYREAQDNTHIARYQYLTALVDFQAMMGEMPMLMTGPEQQQWLNDFNQSLFEKESQ